MIRNVQRDAQRHLCASARSIRNGKLLAISVKMREAVPDIRKSQPSPECLGRLSRTQAATRV
jgi:hypothetical protein